MSIETAFTGRLSGPQMVRTSEKGTRWLSLSVAASIGADETEWISVSCFGDVLESLPDDLSRGERVYVEGKLKVSRYRDKTGVARANLLVNASRVIVLDRIGRRRGTAKPVAANEQPENPGERPIPFLPNGSATSATIHGTSMGDGF